MNHGVLPMRKRSERGLKKVQELERKVQALEEALEVDVSISPVHCNWMGLMRHSLWDSIL